MSLFFFKVLSQNPCDDIVDRFGDKDILMRYIGGGVGHCTQLGVLQVAYPVIQDETMEDNDLLNTTQTLEGEDIDTGDKTDSVSEEESESDGLSESGEAVL